MTVLAIKGQANAAVVLKGLLKQHGMPALTVEGIDALSAKFETGIVIGNDVVSYDGRPLIDQMRSIHADPESRQRFFERPANDESVGNLTDQMRRELAASRKRSMPDDWQAVRAKYATGSVTAKHMDETAAIRRAVKGN